MIEMPFIVSVDTLPYLTVCCAKRVRPKGASLNIPDCADKTYRVEPKIKAPFWLFVAN